MKAAAAAAPQEDAGRAVGTGHPALPAPGPGRPLAPSPQSNSRCPCPTKPSPAHISDLNPPQPFGGSLFFFLFFFLPSIHPFFFFFFLKANKRGTKLMCEKSGATINKNKQTGKVECLSVRAKQHTFLKNTCRKRGEKAGWWWMEKKCSRDLER